MSTPLMETIYEGYKITYSEDANCWIVRDADGEKIGRDRGYASLVLARAAVDRDIKGASSFKPIPVIGYLNKWNGGPALREGKITSFKEDGRRLAARISWEDGERGTIGEGIGLIFDDTPENRERVQNYVRLRIVVEEAQSKADDFDRSLNEFRIKYPDPVKASE